MNDDEAAVAFANEAGRFYSKTYAFPPITGSVAGWLLICEPAQQTAAELSERLQASRSAVGAALDTLETIGYVRRSRVAGERAERVMFNPEYWEQSLSDGEEYSELARLLRRGLELLAGSAPSRRARLLEAAAFTRFIRERMPSLGDEWRAYRDALRASGELPGVDPR